MPGVRNPRRERMGELGAEAQVGVQEVEQEVEGPLLYKVGDEPERTIISLSLMVEDTLTT